MAGAAGFALRHSRMVIGAWIAIAALCGLLGMVSGSQFAPASIVAPGSESERWFNLANDAEFGANVNVLLNGPRREVRQQSEALTKRLRAAKVRVVSPFEDTPGARAAQGNSSLRLLRRDSALLLASVPFHRDQDPAEALTPIRTAMDATVHPPVTSRITGVPTIAEGMEKGIAEATRKAESLAMPLLVIVLLLIFRSPVAAAIPLIMGLGTTIIAGGLVKTLAAVITLDQVAATLASMVALALGVDYSLLLVSRYREHRRDDPGAVRENIETAGRVTGRTIVFAAALLISVMAAAGAMSVGPIMASAAVGLTAATLLSTLTAFFVVPALLKELDPWLDRWQVPRRSGRRAPLLMRRQPIAVPIVALFALLALAAPTMALRTGAPDIKLLPEGAPARDDYEEIGKTVGPGFGAAFNVIVQSRDGTPLTTDRSLAAMTSLQRRLSKDPGIDAVLGPAVLGGLSQGVDGMEQGLTGQGPGLARLDRGLMRAADGSRSAGDGAGALEAASGEIARNSSALRDGIRAAERGSTTLAEAAGRTRSGSTRAARGSNRLSDGAARLSDQVDQARAASGALANNADVLRNDLQTGSDELRALDAPIEALSTQLTTALRALDAMTAGRDDPQFQSALQATRAASQALTGRDPGSGDQPDPGYAGIAAGIADAEGQFDLGRYLSSRLRRQGEATQRGVNQLADGARQLDEGVAQLSAANAQLADGLTQLSDNGALLPEGLSRLSEGASRLNEGVGRMEDGAGSLVTGLGGSQTRGLLTSNLERMQAGLARQRGAAQTGQLQQISPGLFDSGMLPLALVNGSPVGVRDRTQFVLDLQRSGQTAQITAFPAFETNDPRIDGLYKRIGAISHELDTPNLEVAVGGPGASLKEFKDAAASRLPAMIVAFALISLLILIVAVRAIPLAVVCVLLNLLTVGVTFGVMQFGFGSADPPLGGPGHVDVIGLSVTLAVVFALSIDYQIFLLARIREEYVASGSNERAINAAIGSTARIITGAAIVMTAIFFAFCVSSYIGIREIGFGLAIAVVLDATIVRLVLLPAAMRAIGDDVWWLPAWLDRRLPNVSL